MWTPRSAGGGRLDNNNYAMNQNNNKNTLINVDKTIKVKSLSNETHNVNTYSSRIPSDSSDVFHNQSVDSDFQLITNKRNLSSSSPNAKIMNKKNKTVFTSPNKFAPLATNDVNDAATDNNIVIDNVESTHIPSPPPIFARGNFNFIELRSDLIKLIGTQNFFFRSDVKNLKIQTNNSNSYRAVIGYLKERQIEYHTYQLHENKPFRVVIRNLHPSTNITEIGIAIE